MPTYEYACTACAHRFEIVQRFSDDALTTCPNCGGTLRKVFGTPGIVFKGGGFYKTDSRSSSSASVPPSTSSNDTSSTSPAPDPTPSAPSTSTSTDS